MSSKKPIPTKIVFKSKSRMIEEIMSEKDLGYLPISDENVEQ